ncbi:MAG: nuclear transport factor 2 family protein [Burkholderiales bacterium]|nr:nuclear transport factor 2 family protein [Burkholderiales bacterium]
MAKHAAIGKRILWIAHTVLGLSLGVIWMTSAQAQSASAKEQVFAVERSFARTMAERDLQAFSRHLSNEAVFFDGAKTLRGRNEVADGWAPLFSSPRAPFSWEPDQVEVLESGNLALSTGLVKDPGGKVIARFNSIWRMEEPGVWRVVFDKGSPPEPAAAP